MKTNEIMDLVEQDKAVISFYLDKENSQMTVLDSNNSSKLFETNDSKMIRDFFMKEFN